MDRGSWPAAPGNNDENDGMLFFTASRNTASSLSGLHYHNYTLQTHPSVKSIPVGTNYFRNKRNTSPRFTNSQADALLFNMLNIRLPNTQTISRDQLPRQPGLRKQRSQLT
jgi:hypothetical protein